MRETAIRTSKFLSLVLRHKPESVGLVLGPGGWVRVTELLRAVNANGMALTLEELREVVETNDKRRFAFSSDGQSIRASQGHSVEVDLGYEPLAPPALLYHGTAQRFLASILSDGLVKGRRQHVHLSFDSPTAIKVGSRHGKPTVLEVDSGRMYVDGYVFHRSDNGVWLTEHVPPAYIREFSAKPSD